MCVENLSITQIRADISDFWVRTLKSDPQRAADCEYVFSMYEKYNLRNVNDRNDLFDLKLALWRFFGKMLRHESNNAALIEKFKEMNIQYINIDGYGDEKLLGDLLKIATLRQVHLTKSNVTDEGLSQLKELPNLQSIHIAYCLQISEQGVAKMKTEMPKLCIYRC